MNSLDDKWNRLQTDELKLKSTSPNRHGILKISISKKHGLSIGLDLEDGNKILLLDIDDYKIIENAHFPDWEGTLIKKKETDPGKFSVMLKLLDTESSSIFNSLINDLFSKIKNTKNNIEALTCFTDLLFKWYEFFKKYGNKVLSEQRQRGLYGELYLIKNHLIDSLHAAQVLSSWKGHDLKHHDFSFPNGALEVKTTIRKAHKKVMISSEKQLDNTGFNNLFLYCITLNMDSNSGQSLTNIVEELEDYFKKYPGTSVIFNNYISNAGFISDHRTNYDENKYIVKKEYLFDVDDDFPKIIDPPEGLGDIKYSLMIASVIDHAVEITEGLKRLK